MLSQKLESLGISLPTVAGPYGAYVPAKRIGNLVYLAGQLPMKDGKLIAIGQVPSRASMDQARDAAKQCVINALAAVKGTLGTVDTIVSVVRVGVFVNSDPTFTQQPQVANAASEFLKELLGDAGQHVRAAVGVAALPLDAAVEIEFIFEVK